MSIYKILSIDGGGTKGMYSMAVLNEFEKKYCVPNGKLLSDYFHMICGTSVGSLIAIGIALKIPMEKMMSIFETNADIIFPIGKNYSSITQCIVNFYYDIKQLFGDKYDIVPYINILKQIVENKTTDDLHNDICIPSYCISKKQTCVFKKGVIEYDNGIEKYNGSLLDIILASSAAPSYFPPHKLNDQYYIDGGIWANNPSTVGITEAMKYNVGNGKLFSKFSLLSVGNIINTKRTIITHPDNYFNFSKIVDLLSVTIDANSESSEYYIQNLETLTKGIYIRIVHKNDQEIPLDNSHKSFLDKIKLWGKQDAINEMEDNTKIINFFK